MLIRTHWGRFWEAFSGDAGLSWRTVQPSQIESTSAPGSLLKLRSGRRIAAQETILQRVRKLPDQTLDQAMHALWRPIQNNGPTMLSLACDNEKFIIDRDGTLHYGPLRMSVRFAAGTAEVTRLDFGLVGLDSTVRPHAASAGLPLRIAGRTFSNGIGLHASAEVVVPLGGRFQTFEALGRGLPLGSTGGHGHAADRRRRAAALR